MPKVVRFGNTNGRVDKTNIGEATKGSRNLSEGEEVWIDPVPRKEELRRRSSREVDPHRVDLAIAHAFTSLLDAGIFTPGEIAEALKISRATFYRYRAFITHERQAVQQAQSPEYCEYDDDQYDEDDD